MGHCDEPQACSSRTLALFWWSCSPVWTPLPAVPPLGSTTVLTDSNNPEQAEPGRVRDTTTFLGIKSSIQWPLLKTGVTKYLNTWLKSRKEQRAAYFVFPRLYGVAFSARWRVAQQPRRKGGDNDILCTLLSSTSRTQPSRSQDATPTTKILFPLQPFKVKLYFCLQTVTPFSVLKKLHFPGLAWSHKLV